MKEAYLTKGFSNWARKDFRAFILGMEKNGRNNVEAIAAEIEGKTLEEVQAYHSVFWQKYKTLNGKVNMLAYLISQTTRRFWKTWKRAKNVCGVSPKSRS